MTTTKDQPSLVPIIGLMALYVIAGMPLVAYLWETLNDVLALRFEPIRLLIAVPVVLLLVLLLRLLSRRLRRLLET